MEGGGQLPVYRCDTPAACLNPTPGDGHHPRQPGLPGAGRGALLRDLVDAVRADTAPPAAALGLVNLTTLPVYRVANAAAAYRGAVIDQEMDALAEAVALDVMQVWITDLHRTVEERAGTLDIADGEQLQRWREGLRANRVALGAAPPPGPSAAQHRARRGREAAPDRDRARRVRSAPISVRRSRSRAGAPGPGRADPWRDTLYMYELFTLGGGTYLVDLLNAVAAITSGGAYITLAQLAGVVGSRLGPVPHRLRRFVEGQRQVDPAVRHRVGRDDRAQGDRPGGRPARSDARARRGRQRPHRPRALRLADQRRWATG